MKELTAEEILLNRAAGISDTFDMEFALDAYKDVSKEDIIRSRQHFQDMHTKESNENYQLKLNRQELLNWLTTEIEVVTKGLETAPIDVIKFTLVGQRVELNRMLNKLKSQYPSEL